jgi:ABC-type multidrug transport system permease subunit
MSTISAVAALSGRRVALTARTPRQILVPLLTPILFALVIGPALKQALGGLHQNIDYTAFVAIGTVGLLVPLTATFAGLSVIVDGSAGAQRELLAAPVQRGLLVIGNLLVVLGLSVLQVLVLIGVSLARGADFHTSFSGVLWFAGATLLFAVFMYGIAEILASRMPSQEEYIAATPAVAILPWFFAGALFPIVALPGALTAFAKFLPLTHALALMRYGLLGDGGAGLHDVWGMHDRVAMAGMSLGVVALFAAALTVLSIRVFSRSALR